MGENMNNEPVAWRSKDTDGYWSIYQSPVDGSEPLYTHPADESFDRTASHMAGEYVSYPSKDLTDEEIIEIAKDCGYANRYELNIKFARAILRKAQWK